MLAIAGTLSIVGLALGLFFVVYGFRAGVCHVRILETHPDQYAGGRRARVRGVFYMLIGVGFLVGSGLCFAVILAKMAVVKTGELPDNGLQPTRALAWESRANGSCGPSVGPKR
jgi:hypothetical protein